MQIKLPTSITQAKAGHQARSSHRNEHPARDVKPTGRPHLSRRPTPPPRRILSGPARPTPEARRLDEPAPAPRGSRRVIASGGCSRAGSYSRPPQDL